MVEKSSIANTILTYVRIDCKYKNKEAKLNSTSLFWCIMCISYLNRHKHNYSITLVICTQIGLFIFNLYKF
jgi:hypothetical protein